MAAIWPVVILLAADHGPLGLREGISGRRRLRWVESFRGLPNYNIPPITSGCVRRQREGEAPAEPQTGDYPAPAIPARQEPRPPNATFNTLSILFEPPQPPALRRVAGGELPLQPLDKDPFITSKVKYWTFHRILKDAFPLSPAVLAHSGSEDE